MEHKFLLTKHLHLLYSCGRNRLTLTINHLMLLENWRMVGYYNLNFKQFQVQLNAFSLMTQSHSMLAP